MEVKGKTRLRVTAPARPELKDRLRSARLGLGMTQVAFAQALGSSQGAITRWERGIDRPPLRVLMTLAKLVPDGERAEWLDVAGMSEKPSSPDDDREIPVLRDAAAAGTPRAIEDKEISYTIKLPRRLLPQGGKLTFVPVEGDSMSPILETGYLALVDTAARDPKDLVGKMVAARDADGVTIKWLRKQGDFYLLVPQHTSPRHQVQILQESGEWSIVGEVKNWLGWPAPVRK